MSAPAFRCVGGDLVHRTRTLTDEEALWYAAFYRREATAAFKDNDGKGWDWAHGLLEELVAAREEQSRWARAAGATR